MHKITIPHQDFDGNPAQTTAYFNLNKREILDLNVAEKQETIQSLLPKIQAADPNDLKTMAPLIVQYVTVFEDLILAAYGVRDGSLFRKSDQIREDLKASAWYPDWLYNMAQNPEEIAGFIEKLVPQSLVQEAEKQGQVIRQPQDYKPSAREQFEQRQPQEVPISERLVEKNPNPVDTQLPDETPEQMEARIRAQVEAKIRAQYENTEQG